MTPKQQRFCEEYLLDSNASAAARRSGYSEKTAYSIGQENLKKPEVAVELERLRANQSVRTRLTADMVILELARGAYAPIPLDEMRFADKLRCLELLGRHLGMFTGELKEKEVDDKAASQRVLDAIERVMARTEEPTMVNEKPVAE